MEDKYPRVSQAQLEIWLHDPVTKAVKLAFTEFEADLREKVGSGSFRNPQSNDLTCNNISHALGMADAMGNCANFAEMLKHLELLEKEQEDAA